MNIKRIKVTESGKMEWTAFVPKSGHFRSSLFGYLHNECRLNFLNEGTHYCLEMSFSEKCPKLVSPFNITVELKDVFSMSPHRLLSETTMVHRASTYCLWRRSIDDVNRTLPELIPYPQLKFIMTFQTDDTSSACRSTQTDCVFSESSSQTDCVFSERTSQTDNLPSSTTASVQTTWHSIPYPCLESLSHDLTPLLDQGSNPDVEFKCGDHSVKAHRLIVCARSQVIASMLNSDMVENKTGVVNILNMEPDMLTQFLKYLYTGQVDPLTFDAAMSLYEAGDQYAVQGLARRCSKFLMENLTVENACEVLVVADAHSDADFKEAVVGFMLEKQIPLSGDRWQDFCVSHSVVANEVLNRFCKKLSKAQAASDNAPSVGGVSLEQLQRLKKYIERCSRD